MFGEGGRSVEGRGGGGGGGGEEEEKAEPELSSSKHGCNLTCSSTFFVSIIRCLALACSLHYRMECLIAQRAAAARGSGEVRINQNAESVVEWAGGSGRGA